MRQWIQWPRITAGLALAWGVAIPTPANAVYTLIGEIPVNATAANPFNTNGQLNGPFTTYDISFFDPATQLDYLADRTNASVDVFYAGPGPLHNTQVASIPGFVGLRAGTPANPLPVGPPAPGTPTPVTALSGPDGVVIVNGAAGLPNEHQLWAGDGNSTLKAFTLNNNVPPTATPTLGNPPGINTGGQFRVDEGAFDPAHNVLLFANNADNPPFATLVNAATGAILGKLTTGNQLPAATGIEQAVWIGGTTQRFFLNVDNAGAGGVAAIDPTANGGAGAMTHFYDLATLGVSSCGPTGLDKTSGGLLTVVCGSGPVLV
jgi:hypothetical protein